jgi:hypothetical protein
MPKVAVLLPGCDLVLLLLLLALLLLPACLQVAEVLVAALRQPAAANKVVEIVSSPSAAEVPEGKWFEV